MSIMLFSEHRASQLRGLTPCQVTCGVVMVDRAIDSPRAAASAAARIKLRPVAARGPTLEKCGKHRWQGHSLGR